MARVEAGTIVPTALGGMLSHVPDLAYALLERRLVLDRQGDLTFRNYVPDEDYSSWDKGRIFGPSAEVRWIRQAQQLAIVLCGDFSALGLPHQRDLHDLREHRTAYYLWGVRTEGKQAWVELRIPRTFVYPLQASQPRVKLVVYEYYHREDGVLEFYRFTEVHEATGEEEDDASPV